MFDSFTGNDGNISDSDSDGTESTREPLTATLKLAFQPLLIRELRDEVEAYEDFDEGLQGEVITRFYGFYEGVEIDDSEEGGGKRKKVAALLIEDIAEGVGRLCSLPLEDRCVAIPPFSFETSWWLIWIPLQARHRRPFRADAPRGATTRA